MRNKVAVAGVLAMAILMVSAAGVLAQEDAVPVAVAGTVTGGVCPVPETIEVDGDLTTVRDGYCNPDWSLDDPRFGGTVTWAMNSDHYGPVPVMIGTLGVSVVDDEGAWRMVPEVFLETPGVPWPSGPLPTQFVMVGEGAYEGYYAVFTFDQSSTTGGSLEGFIVRGKTPPAPEAAGMP